MIYKFSLSLLYTILIVLCISCSQVTVEEKNKVEMDEITNTIRSCIGWFKDKDFDLLFSVVAQDSNFIEVHPTDRVVRGFEQFKENSEVFKRLEFQYVRHELKDLKIRISNSGDVAWYYCILDDINTWKG